MLAGIIVGALFTNLTIKPEYPQPVSKLSPGSFPLFKDFNCSACSFLHKPPPEIPDFRLNLTEATVYRRY